MISWFHKEDYYKFRANFFISCHQQEDLTLPEWWDAFEVNQLQIERIEHIEQQLVEMKDDVNQHKIQLVEQKENLEQGIGDTLKQLQQMKTPKWTGVQRLWFIL